MAFRRNRRLPKRFALPQRSNRFNPLGFRKTNPLPSNGLSIKKARFSKGWRGVGQKLWYWLRHWTWKKALRVGAGTLAIFLLVTSALFAFYVREIPNPKQLSSRPIDQATKLLDRNGKLIYSFYGEQNRTLLTSDQISNHAKNAAVAIEDHGFYQHSGFSLRGIARAVVCRIYPFCGRYAGGGSTITQQYVRNARLTSNQQTIDRKLRELILSIEVEQIYTKDEILTGYLNEIPYGGAVYGIEAASQTFFAKPAKDLTLSEAATLASIPQRPSTYSPYGSHLDLLFRRKDYVLDQMANYGFVTQEEANAAKLASPSLENPNFAQSSDLVAPHFVFYARQALLQYMDGDSSQSEIELDQAGYTVTTSLDLDAQKIGEAVMDELGPNTIKKYQASNAALVAVDPHNGEILTMVGSVNYDESKSGNTNYANALLQPGSSFKPIVYATAFDPEHKKHPGSITYDLSTDFGNYRPQNYNGQFRGPVTNRNALAQSLNIPAVKNLAIVEVPDAIKTAEKLGVTSLTDVDNYGLSLVLGAGEVRPVELANAYAAFAYEGKHYPLRPILKIEKDGKVLKDFTQEEGVQAIEPAVAFQITSILSDNSARAPVFGTRNNLTLPDRTVAAKSGTTQSNRDAWTVGYTTQIVTAVWVGNNEPNKTMIKGSDGSVVAAPIWRRFMQEYLKGKPAEAFRQPDGLRSVTIDMLSGKLPTDQSPSDQQITELLANWQIPTEFDDVHIKAKIDKVSGKLATALTPADSIEERIYFSVHSEFPNKPNWEGPVQEWARANGGDATPPTESDDVHVDSARPTVSILSPTTGSVINGAFSFVASVGGSQPITKAEFFINNVAVGVRTSAPWQVDYDGSNLPTGTSILEVEVTNAIGLTNSAQISVTKASDTTAPSAVLNPSIIKGSATRSASVSWTNPSDADLAKVNIYVSTSAGVLGILAKTVGAVPSSLGVIEIPNLSLGLNYFTLRAEDSSANVNQNLNQIPFTVVP